MPDSDVCAEIGIYNTSGDDNCKLEEQLAEKVIKEQKIEAMELDSCLSHGTSTLVSESSQLFESSGNFREETSASDRSKTSDLYEENSTLESGIYASCLYQFLLHQVSSLIIADID